MIKFIETYVFDSFFLSGVLVRQLPEMSREQIPLTLFGASATDYHRWGWSAACNCSVSWSFSFTFLGKTVILLPVTDPRGVQGGGVA